MHQTVIPEAEFGLRVERVQRHMAQSDVDTLLAFSTESTVQIGTQPDS